jgi:hypothetical protein
MKLSPAGMYSWFVTAFDSAVAVRQPGTAAVANNAEPYFGAVRKLRTTGVEPGGVAVTEAHGKFTGLNPVTG